MVSRTESNRKGRKTSRTTSPAKKSVLSHRNDETPGSAARIKSAHPTIVESPNMSAKSRILKNKDPYHLVSYDEIPEWLRDNAYIHNYYRCEYTTEMCLRSFFMIHNEVGNVWTHVAGFFLFLGLAIYTFTHVLNGDWIHNATFAILSFGSMSCMAMSSTYHLFVGHMSQRFTDQMRMLDYFGITVMCITSFVPTCFYVFQCNPLMQWGYISMVLVLGMGSILGPMTDVFHRPSFFWGRLAIFASLVCSGLFPLGHGLFVLPLNSVTLPTIGGLTLMFATYLVGVIFYATRFPECYAPGHFDVYLSSHQLWHVFVTSAATMHYFTCIALYQQWQVMKGNC